MTIRLPRLSVAVLALPAAGCFHFHGPPGGTIVLARTLRDLPELQFLEGRRPMLLLPDLRPRSATPFVQGESVTIRVKIENQGARRSGEFDVQTEVSVPGRSPQTFVVRFPNIDPGNEVVLNAGAVTVPTAARPVDIEWTVIADVPTQSRPGGEVWEWDELNNERGFSETIY